MDVDLDFAGPTLHGAAVAGYEGWLAGYQMSFDTAKSRMLQSNFAVGYKTGDFQLHTNMYVRAWRNTAIRRVWRNCMRIKGVLFFFPPETTAVNSEAPSIRK